MTNLQHVVQDVRDRGGWDFTTQAGLCAYSRAVITALHLVDPEWGFLTKTEGQNHCDLAPGVFVAVDAALYRATGEIVDFIGSAGYGTPPPENAVAWSVGPLGEYGPARWLAPDPRPASPPGPGPDPSPVLPPAVDLTLRVVELELALIAVRALLETYRRRMEDINTALDTRLVAVENTPAPPPPTPWWRW